MNKVLASEFVVEALEDARNAASELQSAGYGLEDSKYVNGGGYQFSYVRASDNATSVIFLIPRSCQDEPAFMIADRDSGVPLWQRALPDLTFRNRVDAHIYRASLVGNFEVKPFINIFAR